MCPHGNSQRAIVDSPGEAVYANGSHHIPPFYFIWCFVAQMSLFEPPSWTVADLTRYLRDLLEGDESLQDLWVLGEVSNLSRPSSGHLYFTLKDATAALPCVMWRSTVMQIKYLPQDGDAVEVHGGIGVYEAGGRYQLYADLIRPLGMGALYAEFLRLKARLEGEGLFDESRKRPVPRWPRRLGLVTSPSGAALQDVLNTLRRRYPLVEVVLAPTPVQGEEAPAGIVAALHALNRMATPDVILLVRGGGSIEDLWAFNDERVARAIVASHAPVVSGVGHETDFTIADFASDLRAPTPTAAAVLATPDREDLKAEMAGLRARLERSLRSRLQGWQLQMAALERQLALRSPRSRLRSDRQRLDELGYRAIIALRHQLDLQRVSLGGVAQNLATLNPLAVLGRGFAVVSHKDGRLVRSVAHVRPGDALNVRVSDGQFGAEVSQEA